MCSIKLTLDGTEPIINFKGLRRTSEYRWLEEDEVLNADHHIMMVGGILLDELQKACLITSILLGCHQDFRRRRRWWRFIIISIPITVSIPQKAVVEVHHHFDSDHGLDSEEQHYEFHLTSCVIKINNQNRLYDGIKDKRT